MIPRRLSACGGNKSRRISWQQSGALHPNRQKELQTLTGKST